MTDTGTGKRAENARADAETNSLFPSLEDTRDATLVEGVHLWVTWRDIVSCRWCGLCRPRSGVTGKPCRGIVRVGLRSSRSVRLEGASQSSDSGVGG